MKRKNENQGHPEGQVAPNFEGDDVELADSNGFEKRTTDAVRDVERMAGNFEEQIARDRAQGIDANADDTIKELHTAVGKARSIKALFLSKFGQLGQAIVSPLIKARERASERKEKMRNDLFIERIDANSKRAMIDGTGWESVVADWKQLSVEYKTSDRALIIVEGLIKESDIGRKLRRLNDVSGFNIHMLILKMDLLDTLDTTIQSKTKSDSVLAQTYEKYKEETLEAQSFTFLDNYIREKFSRAQLEQVEPKIGGAIGLAGYKDGYYSNPEIIDTYFITATFPESTPEQFGSLTQKHMQLLTSIRFAYGEEKLREMWSDDAIQDLQESGSYYGTPADDNSMVSFYQKLSPQIKRCLPTKVDEGGSGINSNTRPWRVIWSNEGIQGLERVLKDFRNAVNAIPENRREDVFAYLTPFEFSWYKRTEQGQLSEEQVDNFIEYCKSYPSADKLTIKDFFEIQEYLTPDRWLDVKSGIESFKKFDLDESALKHLEKSQRIVIFEKLGASSGEDVNTLVCTLVKSFHGYISMERGRPKRKNEVNLNIVKSLCDFSEKCRKYMKNDADLVISFLKLNDAQEKNITSFLDGSLSKNADKYPDLPLIVGIMAEVQTIFNGSSRLEQFVSLTRDEKLRYAVCENISGILTKKGEELFKLVRSEESKGIVDFIEQTGFVGFSLDTIRMMAQRKDCIGLYRYFSSEMDEKDAQKMISAFVAAKDAGLPEHYFLSSYNKDLIIGGGDTYRYRGLLINWPTKKLVESAKIAAQIYPEMNFLDVLNLPKDEDIDVIARRIRFGKLEDHTFTGQFASDSIPNDELLDELSQRIQRAEEILGEKVKNKNRIVFLSIVAWDRLQTDADLLKIYLSNGRYFPRGAEKLSGEILKDPIFWKYEFPEDCFADPQKIKNALELVKTFEARGFPVQPRSLEQVIQAQEKAPWLFVDDALSVFVTGYDGGYVKNFAEFSKDEFEMMRDLLKHFSVYSHEEIESLLQYAKKGASPFTSEELLYLHGKLGERISWKYVSVLKEKLNAGWTLDDISKEFDASDEHFGIANNWQEDRKKVISAEWAKKVPTLNECFSNYGTLSVGDREKVSAQLEQLSETTLHNIELLLSNKQLRSGFFTKEFAPSLILITESPNFSVLKKLSDHCEYEFVAIVDKKPEMLNKFCADITEEIANNYIALPEYLHLNLIDCVSFFNYPSASRAIEIGKHLHEIFGESFKPSVYDLLIMDFDVDLNNLNDLKDKCFNAMDKDILEGLKLVSEHSTQETIDKILSIFDHANKIDFKVIEKQLLELPPSLRLSVIQSKGRRSFNWTIFEHRDELKNVMGMTDEQLDELACKLYAELRDGLKSPDYPTARAILQGVEEYDNTNRVSHIIRIFSGTPEQLSQLLLSDLDPVILLKTASREWDIVPQFIKESPVFWDAALRQGEISIIERLLFENFYGHKDAFQEYLEVLRNDQSFAGGPVVADTGIRALKTKEDFAVQSKHFESLYTRFRKLGNISSDARIVTNAIVGAQETIANKNLRNQLENKFFSRKWSFAAIDEDLLRRLPKDMYASLNLLENTYQIDVSDIERLGKTMFTGNVFKHRTNLDKFNYFLLEAANSAPEMQEFFQRSIPLMEMSNEAKKNIFDLTQIIRHLGFLEKSMSDRISALNGELERIHANALLMLPDHIRVWEDEIRQDIENTKKKFEDIKQSSEDGVLSEKDQRKMDQQVGKREERLLRGPDETEVAKWQAGFPKRISAQLENVIGEYRTLLVGIFKEKCGVDLNEQEVNDFLERFKEPGLVFTYIGKLEEYQGQKKLFQSFIESVAHKKFPDIRYTYRNHLDKVFKGDEEKEKLWRQNIRIEHKAEDVETNATESNAEQQRIVGFMKEALFHNHVEGDYKTIMDDFIQADQVKRDNMVSEAETHLQSLSPEAKALPEGKIARAILSSMRLLLAGMSELKRGVLNKIVLPDGSKRRGMSLDQLFKDISSAFADDSPFKNDILAMQSVVRILKEGQSNQVTEGLIAEESEDPDFLLRMGTDVSGSCQNVNGTPALNRNLVSYMMDGKIKTIFVRDGSGDMVGRSILRILYDEESETPVLHLERSYHRENAPIAVVDNMLFGVALEKSQQMGIPLVVSEKFSTKHELKPYSNTLVSNGGPGKTEYVDSIGGSHDNQVYTIVGGWVVV